MQTDLSVTPCYPYSVKRYGMFFTVSLSTIPLADVTEAVSQFTSKYGEPPELIIYPKESTFPPAFSGSQEVKPMGACPPGRLWVGHK